MRDPLLIKFSRRLGFYFRNSSTLRKIVTSLFWTINNSNNIKMETNGERYLIRVINQISTENSLAFDIGANKGEYSKNLLSDHGRLHGFKGTVVLVDPLEENLKLAGLLLPAEYKSRIRYLNKVVTDFEGSTTFHVHVDRGLSGADSLKDMTNIGMPYPSTSIEVECTTVFRIVNDYKMAFERERPGGSVDFIYLKLDIEGAEGLALKGARGVLGLVSGGIDLIQFEFGHASRAFGTYFVEIFNLLVELDYSVFVLKQKELQMIHDPMMVDNYYSYGNFIAIHSPKMVHFKSFVRF